MSFKCEHCQKQQPVGQTINYVVTETRQRTYQNEILYGRMRGTMQESRGSEIVKQIKACPDCYKALTGLEPRIVLTTVAISKNNKVHIAPREETRRPWRNTNNRQGDRPNYNNDRRPQQQRDGQRRDYQPPKVETINPLNKR